MSACSNGTSIEWLQVLMVDEDETDRALFAFAVERDGIQMRVSSVPSVEEAVEYLERRGRYGDRKSHPVPDLIVLALKLTGISGIDFLTWLRGAAELAGIPVVMVSEATYPAKLQKARRLGAEGYIARPGNVEEWALAVKRIWAFGMERRGR